MKTTKKTVMYKPKKGAFTWKEDNKPTYPEKKAQKRGKDGTRK